MAGADKYLEIYVTVASGKPVTVDLRWIDTYKTPQTSKNKFGLSDTLTTWTDLLKPHSNSKSSAAFNFYYNRLTSEQYDIDNTMASKRGLDCFWQSSF